MRGKTYYCCWAVAVDHFLLHRHDYAIKNGMEWKKNAWSRVPKLLVWAKAIMMKNENMAGCVSRSADNITFLYYAKTPSLASFLLTENMKFWFFFSCALSTTQTIHRVCSARTHRLALHVDAIKAFIDVLSNSKQIIWGPVWRRLRGRSCLAQYLPSKY